MVEKRLYETVKEFAKEYRTEIVPMLKSKGFTISIGNNTILGLVWMELQSLQGMVYCLF